MALALLLALLVVAGIAFAAFVMTGRAGCPPFASGRCIEGMTVSNGTEAPIVITLLENGRPFRGYVPTTVEPEHAFYLDALSPTEPCYMGEIVVTDPGGEEIARRTDPLCPGETWEITEPDP